MANGPASQARLQLAPPPTTGGGDEGGPSWKRRKLLFVRDGYPATTMEAIAGEAAGAALKTAYLPFSTKSGLLRALWDLRLKGDEGDPPVVQHQWFRRVIEEQDPVRKLELNARNSPRRGNSASARCSR